jgi:putative oxidoreductase
MKKFFLLSFVPRSDDLALLILRVSFGVILFVKHGWEKLSNFSAMAATFPDPLHMGQSASLGCALLGDAICSVLVLVGLGTRLFSAVAVVNLLVAFAFVHHFSWFGANNGELAYVYLCAYLALFVAGPGRYSVDRWIASGRVWEPSRHRATDGGHSYARAP